MQIKCANVCQADKSHLNENRLCIVHSELLFLEKVSMQMNNTLNSCPQAFWSPDDTGLVFVGWWHEPFRLGVKYCANRRWAMGNMHLMKT